MSRPQLTPDIEQAIVSFIRAGGFPHVAAEAAGVPVEVFDEWLARGEKPGAAKKYRNFAQAVRQATAQARLGAEVDIRTGKPIDWLKHGPGRQTPESVGWTGPARASTAAAATPALLTPEVQRLIAALLDALRAHPEARTAVAAALQQLSSDLTQK